MDRTAPDHPNPAPGLDPGVDPGIALRLPADAYYHLARTLCLTLPPPASDDPEHLRQRNYAAIAAVAALGPANAAEARLAAGFVAADEQANDCLRLAQAPDTTAEWAAKCRAEARSMMREAKSALRVLLKLQDLRAKRDANSVACTATAWSEHRALSLMAEELAAQPAMPAPASEPEEKPGPVAEVQPAPAPLSGVAATLRRAETDPDLVAGAERYAALYPERAALIRRTGKLPPDVRDFEPPEAALASALIAGRTPALIALDREYAEARVA